MALHSPPVTKMVLIPGSSSPFHYLFHIGFDKINGNGSILFIICFLDNRISLDAIP